MDETTGFREWLLERERAVSQIRRDSKDEGSRSSALRELERISTALNLMDEYRTATT